MPPVSTSSDMMGMRVTTGIACGVHEEAAIPGRQTWTSFSVPLIAYKGDIYKTREGQGLEAGMRVGVVGQPLRGEASLCCVSDQDACTQALSAID